MNLFNRSSKLSHAYKQCFCDEVGNLTLAGQQVIQNLQNFCCAHDGSSTATVSNHGTVDPVYMALNEGKRVVFSHIKKWIKVSDAELDKASNLDND